MWVAVCTHSRSASPTTVALACVDCGGPRFKTPSSWASAGRSGWAGAYPGSAAATHAVIDSGLSAWRLGFVELCVPVHACAHRVRVLGRLSAHRRVTSAAPRALASPCQMWPL